MSTMKRVLIYSLTVIAAGLAILHISYPLPYVFDVMVRQDPDYFDFEYFPANGVAPSESPISLPNVPDASVVEIIESHPDIETLDGFVAATETTALLVVHDGEIVLERYGLGHTAENLENTFSVSKSIASALAGIAAADGVLSIDDPITDYLPGLLERDPRFGAIRIENLLDMTSGIAYSRKIRFPIINNDDPLVYYHPDLASVVLNRTTIDSEPGSFRYTNYNPPLLGLILRQQTGVTPSEFLEQRIWGPIGAERSAGWTTDEQGVERMESGFHARVRDQAKFGLLYLNLGRVNGRQVIPEDWVRSTTDTRTKIELEEYDGRQWGYRAGWWIVPRPEGRSDYSAIGRTGQFIYVSPQFNTVVVRNGPGRGDWGDRDWTELFYFLAERLSRASD